MKVKKEQKNEVKTEREVKERRSREEMKEEEERDRKANLKGGMEQLSKLQKTSADPSSSVPPLFPDRLLTYPTITTGGGRKGFKKKGPAKSEA
ncbi:MAG TPA: hypothetical protein VN701_00930 [Candidatus Paceibacterota bacterium]|nr:hypothetical protein [Candidatus Paceibacterota bacterium]